MKYMLITNTPRDGYTQFMRWPKKIIRHPRPSRRRRPRPVEKNLKVFDVLDVDVISNQKWDRLKESHDKDIVVTWPGGHATKGIETHISDLKAIFVYAPDITIKTASRFSHGQAIRARDGDQRPLDEWDDGPRVAVLGQR
jgi:hypothetical protein